MSIRMSGKRYTTIEIAEKARVPRATLQYWIATGKIYAPKVQLEIGRAVRYWNEADLSRIRKLKGTLKPGPKSKSRNKD
jgi:DNA-binding transcriptional MerR regulator